MTRGQLLKMSNSAIDKGVRIAGTKFDRRIKCSKGMVNKMRKLRNTGKSYSQIAAAFNVASTTVQYHLDEDFKARRKAERSNYKASKPITTPAERAEYKRALLKGRKSVIIAE